MEIMKQLPNLLNHDRIMIALDWAYEKSINGIPGFDSAEELAANYQNKADSAYNQANMLIRYQNKNQHYRDLSTELEA